MFHSRSHQQGFSMVLVLSLVALMSFMLITYSIITVNNARTAGNTSASSSGFYVAEAVLNARADRIRRQFKGFLTPSGTSPSSSQPCTGSDVGSGDMACENLTVNGRAARSYVTRSGTPASITIPVGERFANLTAQETPFTVYGQALNSSGNPEAIANLVFRSRVVPLFQFAVFFDKDMEFDNTAQLSFTGPIHSNGNIFLDAGSDVSLSISGQLTGAHDIYRRQKRSNVCTGTVNIADNAGTMKSLACNSGTALTNTNLKTQYGGTVESQIGELEVPSIAALQPSASAEYWQKADLRVVLKRRGGLLGTTWEAQMVTVNGTVITVPSSSACNYSKAASGSYTFRDNREAQYWEDIANQPERATKRLLEIDVRELLTCIQKATNIGVSGGLSNSTDGGLVIFLTVDDSASDTVTSGLLGVLGSGSNGAISQTDPALPNNYGVRLRNGAVLRSNDGTKPMGVTFVTDQAAYIVGDFNKASSGSSDWVPSAILADSMNILSNSWDDATPDPSTCAARDGSFPSPNSWVRLTYYPSYKYNTLIQTPPAGYQITNMYRMKSATEPLRTRILNRDYFTYANKSDAQYLPSGGLDWKIPLPSIAETPFPSGDMRSHYNLNCRYVNGETIVNTAILAGTATTGDEGALYSGIGKTSGGVHNMMRFHEDWGANGGNPNGAQRYSYRGSLVSLDKPQHAVGDFVLGNPIYNPPVRNWAFETNFRDSANLPPLTPRFVYIKQDNFVRNFSQQ
ncbi:hypothetical protein [Deinococcus actinosclerus]|uniref:hypothetical protein n=1 Tax=Deinococcus actinosclerus TaxID=1768108 RepID=UPI000AA26D60|nr:hypothetical protein [Deinococcus actinosclerus]